MVKMTISALYCLTSSPISSALPVPTKYLASGLDRVPVTKACFYAPAESPVIQILPNRLGH